MAVQYPVLLIMTETEILYLETTLSPIHGTATDFFPIKTVCLDVLSGNFIMSNSLFYPKNNI